MQGIETTTTMSIDEAETAIRAALTNNGFGVLTEIDVAATLKAKLDIDRTPLKILGACNPNLAHRALTIDPSVALLLPCNVVLEESDGVTTITAVDPRELMNDPGFNDLAAEAADKLRAAIESVG